MFNDTEKVKLANIIINNYYANNFGSLSKADLELLLFDFYVNECKSNRSSITDYSLSRQLGISQPRIRSLKEKRILRLHNGECSWREEFANAIENAKYDDTVKKIKLIIQDINVQNEIRNYIEEKGWYDDYSLNRKMIQISLDCFLEICCDFSSENVFSEKAKKEIVSISKKYKDENTITNLVKDFTKDNLKEFAQKASTEILKEVLKVIPFGGLAATMVEFLVERVL